MRSIFVDVDIPRSLVTKLLRPLWPGVVWSALSPTRLQELPDGPLPGPRWVRLQNRQCGICGSDLTLLQVKAHPRVSIAAMPGMSRFYLGHEVVSDVVEVGAGVSTFAVGDRVVMDSRSIGPTCLSQQIEPRCQQCSRGRFSLCGNQSARSGPTGWGGGWGDGYVAHESEVFAVPDSLSDDQATLIEPASVALHAVLRHPPEPGNRVLVVGSGIIGLFITSVLKIVEPRAKVTSMARYTHQAEMARQMGADAVIRSDKGYEAASSVPGAELYEGPLSNRVVLGGFDLIHDVVGNARSIQDSLRWTKAGGAVVVVGVSPVLHRLDLSPIWHQEIDLVGALGHGVEAFAGQRTHAFSLVSAWMQAGCLPTHDLITHRFSLEEYRTAIATALDKRTGAIKVVFTYESAACGR